MSKLSAASGSRENFSLDILFYRTGSALLSERLRVSARKDRGRATPGESPRTVVTLREATFR
jgi:hypothetical protein